MEKLTNLLCMIVVLGTASISLALDPLLIGDFEDGESSPGRYDLWYEDGTVISDTTIPGVAASRGTHSLKITSDTGGWGPGIWYPINERTDDKYDLVYPLCANDGAVLGFDVTFETVPGGWIQIGLSTNNGGGVDPTWDKSGWVDVPAEYLDGAPHSWAIPLAPLQESLQSVIDAEDDGGYYNIGIAFNTDDGPLTVYVDNIWIYPEGATAHLFPHNPGSEQSFASATEVDVTLTWKAAGDPGDPNRLPDPNVIYPVHPDIVDEYIFMADAAAADANLLYVSSTGIDPGTDDPNSSYVMPYTLPINSTYYWVVVEAMDGYEQTLTPGVSRLIDVDPNNIIGPTWVLQTLSTLPVIETQPESTRFGVADVSVEFTIDVNSITPESYQWFYSKDEVIDAGDNPIASGTTDTLTITSHNKAYQAYYYCRVSNAATVSGGGSKPDVYSDVVSLVVERKVAEYLFNGNVNDTSGEGNNGTPVGSPTFTTDAVEGTYALSLNGTSTYVEIGDSGDPNTFNKCFPRADLLGEGGIGGGLDVGTVTCWVKLSATVADQVSPIMQNGNSGWPITAFHFEILTDAVAANTNLRSYIWGDTGDLLYWMDINPVYADPFDMGGDSQWHMLALTWDMNGSVKAYLDGNLLADWDAGPSTFSAWDSTMTIGFDGTNYFDGLIDNLKIYNYELTAEEIVDEYGEPGCIYDFDGSNHNSNQLGSSYCKLDLADFADLAAGWLNDGFYTPAP